MIGLGEGAAIAAACVWAFSTVLYKRFSHHLSPFELNVTKGVIAVALMLFAILVTSDTLLPSQLSSWGWLIASGILGIAIGDSAYFAALRNIGPARTLVIESLAPAIAGMLNIVILGVYLSASAWLGIIITTLGVMLAIKPSKSQPVMDKKHYLLGCFCVNCRHMPSRRHGAVQRRAQPRKHQQFVGSIDKTWLWYLVCCHAGSVSALAKPLSRPDP